MKKRLITAGTAVFWILVWQIAAMLVGKSLLLASPAEVAQRLVTLIPDEKFLASVLFSTGKIMLGFLSGTVIGLVFAVLAGRFVFF